MGHEEIFEELKGTGIFSAPLSRVAIAQGRFGKSPLPQIKGYDDSALFQGFL